MQCNEVVSYAIQMYGRNQRQKGLVAKLYAAGVGKTDDGLWEIAHLDHHVLAALVAKLEPSKGSEAVSAPSPPPRSPRGGGAARNDPESAAASTAMATEPPS
jgi:hypothetical protein